MNTKNWISDYMGNALKKRQVCISIDEDLYNELKKLSEKSGLPLSQVVVLRLKGFEVIKSGV